MNEEKDLKEQFNILFEDLDNEAQDAAQDAAKDVSSANEKTKAFFNDALDNQDRVNVKNPEFDFNSIDEDGTFKESGKPAPEKKLSEEDENTRRKIYEMGEEEDEEPTSFEKEDDRKQSFSSLPAETKRFWIFTGIIAVLTIAAIFIILFARGILGGGEKKPDETKPSKTDSVETLAPTDSSEKPTDDTTEPVDESTEAPSSETPTEPEPDESSVADNYSNLFIVRGETDMLNVREEPNTSAKILAKLAPFAGGEILETAGDWLKISSNGIEGYVNAGYCLTGDAAKSQAAAHAVKLVKALGVNGVNVRSGPSTSSEILETVPKGRTFEYVGEQGSFYKIRFDADTEGYISKDYSKYGYFLKEAEKKE